MADTNSQEFKNALKEFDNKNYEKVRKICDRLIEKNEKDDKALALKGLNYYYLNKIDEAEKTLKLALKANLKSGVAWHFYAIFQKERGNYTQSMKSYNYALRNAPTNYNIIRDLSYVQLYLRQLNSFVDSCKLAIDNKPGLLINWVSFAFGCALIKNYEQGLLALNSATNMGTTMMNKNERHEMAVFNAFLQMKMGKYEDAMKYLIMFKSECVDRNLVFEMIIKNAFFAKKFEVGLDYCMRVLSINYENANNICWFFNMKINESDFFMKNFQDLCNIPENYKYKEKLLEGLTELKNKFPKSKVLFKLELAFNQNDEFKKLFENYFLKQVEITIPSFYINVKFIYQLQKYKLVIIEEILNKYLENISKNKNVTEKLNLPMNIAWVYFYASQHYLFLGELEKAFTYINQAIDLTPSVVEFFMILAKIFKHSFMSENYIYAFNKARLLDVGDRYLNAKMGKLYAREGKIQQSIDTMKEFVSEPLTEESITSYQNLWYLYECGCSYLQNKNIIKAHYIFQNIVNTVLFIIKDQFDFYNFCLRRYMLTDLYHTIVYFDSLAKNKYACLALSKLDLIYSYLSQNKENKTLEEKFIKDFEEMKNDKTVQQYEFKTITELIKKMEDDFYTILKKMQNLTKSYDIHYLCVKYFLKKSKLLMAVKSLKVLSEDKISFYFVTSLKLVKKYLEENKANLNEIISNKANEVLKEGDESKEYKENDGINNILFKLYEKNTFENAKENNSVISEIVNAYDVKEFRRLKSEKVYDTITVCSLYTDEEGVKEFKNKLCEKMKLTGIDEKELARNLDFYENKKFN